LQAAIEAALAQWPQDENKAEWPLRESQQKTAGFRPPF
jgi:hypothetical protein